MDQLFDPGDQRWRCKTCHATMTRNHFYSTSETGAVLTGRCKGCRSMYMRARNYGLTLEELTDLYQASGWACAACGIPFDQYGSGSHVDHDHECCERGAGANQAAACGRCVRGVLCRGCNLALGNAMDSPDRLRALADYIEHRTIQRQVAA